MKLRTCVLFVLLALVLGGCGKGPAEPAKPLSEWTAEEQLRFLEENGIELPAFADGEDFPGFLTALISQIEKYPDIPAWAAYSNPATCLFASRVEEAVKSWYGMTEKLVPCPLSDISSDFTD